MTRRPVDSGNRDSINRRVKISHGQADRQPSAPSPYCDDDPFATPPPDEQCAAARISPPRPVSPVTTTATVPAVAYESKAAETNLARHFNDINTLFGTDFDAANPIRVRWATGDQNKGGHFTPGSRGPRPKRPSPRSYRVKGQAAYDAAIVAYRDRVRKHNNTPLAPEIRVVRRTGTTDSEVRLTAFHEWAHAADFQPGDGGSSGALAMRTADQKRIHNQHRTGNLARWSDMPPDTGEPVHDFLAAASRVESLETYRTTRIDGYTPTFEVHQYMKSPVELWARATAQWARREIDGDAMAGTSPRMHTFTADEIDALAPRIEAVLDARGQLRR